MSMALRVGRAAEGHGDDAVPPDDALADRGADHRGLSRRGCLPPQLRGQALPRTLRAERDGARLARRHLPRRADRDRRGPRGRGERPARPPASRGREDHRAAARDAGALDGVRGHRPDPRADPGSAGRALPHGRCRHRCLGRDLARGPLRRRGGRVRLRARRQPARRQRADGDDHVRQARGPPRSRVGSRQHDGRACRRRSSRTPSAT